MVKVGYARVIEKRTKLLKTLVNTQFCFMIIIVVFGYLIFNIFIAGSLLVGSLCSVIPSVFFSYRALLYKFKVEGNSKKFLVNILYAEVIKFILISCMLIVSYKFTESLVWLSEIGILVGFILTYMSGLFAPLIVKLLVKIN